MYAVRGSVRSPINPLMVHGEQLTGGIVGYNCVMGLFEGRDGGEGSNCFIEGLHISIFWSGEIVFL